MKLIAFLLLAALLHVCRPVLSKRVSISGKNISIEKVFLEIKKQTGFEFLYQSSLLHGAQTVTLDAQQRPVEEILKICLEGQGLDFNIRSGTIIIFKPDEPGKTAKPAADQDSDK